MANKDDLKLIRHNAAGIDLPDEPDYPFILDANLTPPELMKMTFIMLYGGSEIIRVRGKTRESIEELVREMGLARTSRLRRLTISHEVRGIATTLHEVVAGGPLPIELG